MEIAACKLPAHWVVRSKEGHVVMEVVLPDLRKDGILILMFASDAILFYLNSL